MVILFNLIINIYACVNFFFICNNINSLCRYHIWLPPTKQFFKKSVKLFEINDDDDVENTKTNYSQKNIKLKQLTLIKKTK